MSLPSPESMTAEEQTMLDAMFSQPYFHNKIMQRQFGLLLRGAEFIQTLSDILWNSHTTEKWMHGSKWSPKKQEHIC